MTKSEQAYQATQNAIKRFAEALERLKSETATSDRLMADVTRVALEVELEKLHRQLVRYRRHIERKEKPRFRNSSGKQ